jgi:heterotetrameric sarcosine oxidase gamma subunit
VHELLAKSALAGQAPLTAGGATLSEALPGPITSLAAFPGTGTNLAKKLGGFPEPNRFLEAPLRVWTGPDQCFLIGAPAPEVAGLAATTDQSGGWAALTLEGPGAEAALMRLYPLDLRAKSFPQGHAARAPLGHMQSVLLRTGPDTFLILVFRSMARTAWHELAEAMHHLQARADAGV